MRATHAATSSDASDTTSAAWVADRWPSGTGGVGTPSDASCSISRSTAADSGRSCTRYSAGIFRSSRNCATCSLAAIIRCSISR